MAGTLTVGQLIPDVGTNLYLNAQQYGGNVVIGNATTQLFTFGTGSTLTANVFTANTVTSNTVTATSVTANVSSATVTTTALNISGVGIGAGNASIMKNHLINGAMQVWQRGTTQTFTNAIVYGSVDRWAFIQGGGSASISQTQSTSVPSGFQYSVKQQRTASSTTTGTVYSLQEIESINCYDMAGQTATFSFWAKCGANFSASGSTLTSLVYQGTGTDQGTTSWISGTWTSPTSNTQSNTLTTTWQRFSQTVTIGASTTEILVSLQWVPVGTAGADDSVYFTGVQLEVGSNATGYEYENYTSLLQKCQRYYAKETSSTGYVGFGSGYLGGSNVANIYTKYPVTMRTAPTIAFSNLILIGGGTSGTVSTLGVYAGSDSALLAPNTSTSPFTAYQGCALTGDSSGTGFLTLSAEL